MSRNRKQTPMPDADWLEAQYDNRRRVPEFAQHIARWRESSALSRAGLRCHLDVPYMPLGVVTLDVFPATRRDAPVLVFMHGGYWRTLDKSDFSFVAAIYVAAGAMVVVPNYSLCPSVTIDTIALQTAHALAWVHRHAEPYGGNAARTVVAGHSAGGHLAAMMLTCNGTRLAPDLPAVLARRAISISGLYDLAPIAATPSLQIDLRLTREVVARTSPARFAAPEGAQLCSVVGALESEEFLRQNRLIQDCWGVSTVPVCEEVPARNHFTVLDDLIEPTAALHGRTLRWLFE